jgi:hypothetical protein
MGLKARRDRSQWISLELTIKSNILPIAFFVADVQGRYTACIVRMQMDSC